MSDKCNSLVIAEADPAEFSVYYVIYGHRHKNVWFPTKMENVFALMANVKAHYWGMCQGKKVAGFIRDKNWFGFVFTIPPYDDQMTVIQLIVSLISESNEKKITVSGVYPDSYHNYQRLGFQIYETERIMIRPTEQFFLIWHDDFEHDIPKQENLNTLVDLYYRVYRNSPLLCMSDKKRKFYEDLLNKQLPMVEKEYSTVLYHTHSREIIASCLVIMWQELPYIADIVVAESFRGQGLGTMMIKKVLNNAYGKYPAVRLATRAGNRAEGLYYRLGFAGGVESSTLKTDL